MSSNKDMPSETSNDSNVKEAKASTSSSNNFKTVANDYQAKDTVDVKINDDLITLIIVNFIYHIL
jgi:hypothetical protein